MYQHLLVTHTDVYQHLLVGGDTPGLLLPCPSPPQSDTLVVNANLLRFSSCVLPN
jgi:hypothetical protein